MTEPYDDDRLAARLRALDPASSLPPADPARVDRLLEDAMSHDVLTESREDGTRNRSPLTWLVAAAAAVVIVGVGVFVIVNGLNADEPSSPPQAAPPHAVVQLSAPGSEAYSARCAVPTAALLAGQPLAFDGRVTSIQDDVVTLRASSWFAGGAADEVQVEAPPEALGKLLASVHFEQGQRYLVVANDDNQVVVCGLSARYSPHLASLYHQAFGG